MVSGQFLKFLVYRMFSNAVVRELEILGEAANHISQKTQQLFPEFPWKQIIGMRNTLIHAYFDVDYDIIWETVSSDLPIFYHQLKKVVSEFTKKHTQEI